MNTLKEIKTTVLITLVLLIVCCCIYPVFVFGAGQLLFPDKADGSIVYDANGKPIASTLLGQTFAAGNGYDSTQSGGSNLGALSQTLHDNVKQRVADYRKANNLGDTQLVPADAVTASGSGLDPHISVKNALIQLPRVAKARGMSEGDVKALMEKYTDGPDLGILGDAGVNIVKLNLALDGKYK
jgi:K+-transporting ATPase ATPase C chain